MGLSIRDQERIVHKFFEEFACKAPFSKYVNGAAIEEDEAGEFLSVLLRAQLPSDMKLPDTFENLRVKIDRIGEIFPLGSD